MNAHQQRSLFSFRRVVNFVDARPQLTASTPEGRGLAARVEALRGVITRVTSHASDQHVLADKATRAASDEPVLKKALVDRHLRNIVKVATGLRGSVPGIGVLRMPERNDRNATLIEEATAFAHQAEIYAPMLTEHGLPSDVVGQLRTAIDAFRASIDARGSARADLHTATAGVKGELALGRSIIVGLDGAIGHMLHDEQSEIAAWQAAKRIGRGTSGAQTESSPEQTKHVGVESLTSLVQPEPSADQRAA